MLPSNHVSHRDPLQNMASTFSIPTAYAIDGLEKLYGTGKGPEVVMVNIATLLRNHLNVDKTLLYKDLYQKLLFEMEALIQDVGNFMTRTPGKPTIIFYLIDYKVSLHRYMRPPTSESRKRLQTAVEYGISRKEQIFKDVPKFEGNVQILTEVYNRSQAPHKHLVGLLRHIGPNPSYIMLSHCPFDYHVSGFLRKFLLIESHTGKVKTIDDLGTKILKSDKIPLTPFTHCIFGDKDYALPQLGRSDKKEILSLSDSQHWEMRTPGFIETSIKKVGTYKNYLK